MAFTPLAAVGTLVFAVVNFLKYLSGRDWNGVVTQAIAWIGGIVGLLIAAHTKFAPGIKFGDISLDKTDLATQIFLGLIATSILSTVNEVKKAIDNTDTAQTPHLLSSQGARERTAAAGGSGGGSGAHTH